MYKHILVATDLVPHSAAKVLKAALELAQKFKATVDVLHVVEDYPLVYGGDTALTFTEEQEVAIDKSAKKQLQQLCARYDVKPEHQHVIRGFVKTEVTDFAKKKKVDLIIVGTHSHHGLEVLLGSRADAILHSAAMDVLAIRTNQ